jgi:1,4-dihydroxy-6-naphthoate synthase
MPFDEIMPAVAGGEVDAGVIIHESRFTYPDYGLRAVVDLGSWWEETTGYPIPLGGIVIRRSLGPVVAAAVDAALRASVAAAVARPEASWEYTRAHAQEMDAGVCREHIALYVNEYSLDYGVEGAAAVRRLLRTAAEVGAAPASAERSIFWDDPREEMD